MDQNANQTFHSKRAQVHKILFRRDDQKKEIPLPATGRPQQHSYVYACVCVRHTTIMRGRV